MGCALPPPPQFPSDRTRRLLHEALVIRPLLRSLPLLLFVSCAGTPDDVSEEPGSGGQSAGGSSPSSGGSVPTGGGAPSATGGFSSGGTLTGGSGGSSSGGSSDHMGGGAPSGGTSSGGTAAGGDSPSGGAPAGSGGEPAGAGGAVEPPGPYFPAPSSTNQCPDPTIRLRFDGPPKLGSSGSVKVFDAENPGSPVAQVNMAASQVTDMIGGSTFTLPRPAFVYKNEAIFVLPAKGLTRGRTYFVTIDSGVVRGPNDQPVVVSDPEAWRFSVAPSAPSNKSTLRVSVDGQGQFCTLQGAIDAAENGSTLELGEGAFYGVTYFKGKNNLTISGAGRDKTRIAGVNNNNLNPSTRGRSLFGTEQISGLLIEDVTIENETPQGGSQAEALTLLSCDKCIVRWSTIISRQDTLLWSGRIYAEDSRIEGNVDYIWGTGTAYFYRVEIKTIGRAGYNVQARNPSGSFGYVFVDSKLTADPGITGDVLARIDVSAYPASHVAYINCEMGSHISPAGFTITGGGSTANLRFWEYQSRTPGGALVSTSQRAAGSKQLTANEAAQMRDVTYVLGGWDPNSAL